METLRALFELFRFDRGACNFETSGWSLLLKLVFYGLVSTVGGIATRNVYRAPVIVQWERKRYILHVVSPLIALLGTAGSVMIIATFARSVHICRVLIDPR